MPSLIGLLLVSVVWLASCGPAAGGAIDTQKAPAAGAQADLTSPPALDPDEIALGEAVYGVNCASCHGIALEGEIDWKTENEDDTFRSPPHDETGHTWHHGDEALLEAIRLGGSRLDGFNIGGSSEMPGFSDILSEPEIAAVLTFIKSSWPEDIRLLQWQVASREAEQRASE